MANVYECCTATKPQYNWLAASEVMSDRFCGFKILVDYFYLKSKYSEKATKIEKIFQSIWSYLEGSKKFGDF